MLAKRSGLLVPRRPTLEQLEDRQLLSAGITELPLPIGFGQPVDITAGPDGNLWFTLATFGTDTVSSDHVGRITSGSVTRFPVPAMGTIIGGGGAGLHITAGPDGNLWYTEIGLAKIGRLSPNGVVTEFPLASTNGNPGGITAGPDGNLWFTENLFPSGLGKIGRISPSGVVTEFPIATPNSAPSGIARGSDGNLWFTENGANQIGRITPDGIITEFTIPTAGSGPTAITAGPDGNLWFVEELGNRIGQITPSGSITEFAIPTANSQPNGITAGPDGNLWFTESLGNNVGQISLAGRITEFSIPTANSYPAAITTGADGNLWFTEEAGGLMNAPANSRIGEVVLNITGTPDERFVSQIYFDFLHRPADPAGLASWTGALSLGVSRTQVVQAIEESPEYRAVVVQDLYNRLLRRPADASGLSTFTTFLANGGTVEQVEATLAGSAEYFRIQGGNNESFLDALYRDTLNRTIDPAGRSAFGQALNNGVPPEGVAAAIFGSDEFRQDLVQAFYQRLLHRPAETAGLQGWTAALQAGSRDEQVLAAIAGSAEYFLRLAPNPPGP
jgi:streptogramin lyase